MIRRSLVVPMLLFSFLMTGCHRDGTLAPPEIFDYKFQFSSRTTAGAYEVRRASQPGCGSPQQDVMRLDQIALVVQSQGTGFESLKNCGAEFYVNLPAAREDNFSNKLKVREGPTPDSKFIEVVVNGPEVSGLSQSPTGMLIQPLDALAVGQKTTHGLAEIYFGPTGPIFRCQSEGTDDPWDQHVADPSRSTFFEFQLTALNSDFTRGSANFQCLARNENDPADTRLMIVMDGTLAMVVH